MSDKDWIPLHRRPQDHWIYQEKRQFSRYEAWIDLLMMANHKDNKSLIDGELVTVKKGSLITSIRKLCDKWNWSNTKVNNFLRLLQEDEMITYKSDTKKTVINICNYSVYHDSTDDENDAETTQKRQWNIDENKENVINRKNNGGLNDTEKTGKTVDISSSVMDEHFYKTTQKRHRNDTEAFQEHTNKNDKECIKNDKEVFSSSTRDEKFAEVMEFYQMNLQRGISETPHNLELLNQFYVEFGHEVLLAAMKVSAENEAKGVRFLEGVLNNWREAGVKNVEDARRYELEFRRNQKNKYRANKPNYHHQSNEVIPDWFEKRHEQTEQQDDEDESNIIEMQQILAKYKSN